VKGAKSKIAVVSGTETKSIGTIKIAIIAVV